MFLFDVYCRNSLKRAHVFGLVFGFTDAVRFDFIHFRIEIEFFKDYVLCTISFIYFWRLESSTRSNDVSDSSRLYIYRIKSDF